VMSSKDTGASPPGTGLSPTVEPASGLDGSATSIPSAVLQQAFDYIMAQAAARDFDPPVPLELVADIEAALGADRA
jgi:hypothetical protein